MNFADDLLQKLPPEVRTTIRALEAKASCHEERLVGYEQQVVGYLCHVLTELNRRYGAQMLVLGLIER